MICAFRSRRPARPSATRGENAYRTPSFNQWDLGVDSFPHPLGYLQFRSEFFNVLTDTNFGFPDATITDAAFGTIRQTYPARQIQFAMKLLF